MPIALTIAQPLRHAPPLPLVPLRAPRGLALSFLIDVFFIADIFVNLRTMVVVEGRLIASTRAIFLHYARSWLALDLVASFPFDWLDGTFGFRPPPTQEHSATSEMTELLRVLRLVRLLRLLRVARLFRYLGKWEAHSELRGRGKEPSSMRSHTRRSATLYPLPPHRQVAHTLEPIPGSAPLLSHTPRMSPPPRARARTVQWLNMNVLRLLKLFVALLLFSHWNGCMQYFLATFDTTTVPNGGPNNTTTVRMHEETWVVRAAIDPETEPLALMRWSWSFYQAMTQLLAISVGIVDPRRPAELWVNLISILCGAALYAIFVGRNSP